ncbi:MAG TPA: hypothetical protein VF089_05760 [Candidatus Binatia bacterium]
MHGPALAILTFLFALRVLGQALVVFFRVDWLPGTEHWFSGVFRYPVLLAIQLVMLPGMAKIASDVWRGRGFFAKPRPGCSPFLVACSIIYAISMVLRYALTMAYRPEMRWFGGTIPIFFHFVLAAFVYTWGKFYSKSDTPSAQQHF